MAETKKRFTIAFYITMGVSIVLIVVGFVIPPAGVVDGSVLTAVGELFAFAALAEGSMAIRMGLNAKIRKGDTELEVTQGDQPEKTETATAE